MRLRRLARGFFVLIYRLRSTPRLLCVALIPAALFLLPLPPRFRETGGCSSRRPLHTHPLCRLGSLLIFSGWDIEDDLAPENVRSWEKETCWR